MKSINIHEAKTKLSSLLSEIERGGEFLICRNGAPVADLVPHKRRKRTKIHPVFSKIKINLQLKKVSGTCTTLLAGVSRDGKYSCEKNGH